MLNEDFSDTFNFIESKLYASVHNIIYHLVPQCRYKQALWMMLKERNQKWHQYRHEEVATLSSNTE
jgi:hypothetical protein